MLCTPVVSHFQYTLTNRNVTAGFINRPINCSTFMKMSNESDIIHIIKALLFYTTLPTFRFSSILYLILFGTKFVFFMYLLLVPKSTTIGFPLGGPDRGIGEGARHVWLFVCGSDAFVVADTIKVSFPPTNRARDQRHYRNHVTF